jgi:hypothetical protein
MGIPGLGDGALAATLTTGISRGRQSQVTYELSGIINASQITQLRYDGDGHGELYTTQSLKRLDHRLKTPGFDVVLAFLFETLQAFGVFIHRPNILLKDNLLSRHGTDHFREPPEVDWAPSGPARIADIVSEQKGFEAELGSFEIANRIFASPREVADGFVFHGRDIDRAEIA